MVTCICWYRIPRGVLCLVIYGSTNASAPTPARRTNCGQLVRIAALSLTKLTMLNVNVVHTYGQCLPLRSVCVCVCVGIVFPLSVTVAIGVKPPAMFNVTFNVCFDCSDLKTGNQNRIKTNSCVCIGRQGWEDNSNKTHSDQLSHEFHNCRLTTWIVFTWRNHRWSQAEVNSKTATMQIQNN